MPEDLMPWHKTFLVNPEYNRVDFVKEGANSQAHIKLFKSKGGQPMNFEEIIAKMKPEHAAVIRDEITAQVAAEVAKAKEEAAAAVPQPLPTSEEEILKSVKDPAVKALLETQIAKTRAAEDKLRQANEEALEAEAVSKAKEASNLGAEEAAMASIYKRLKGHDVTLCEEVFSIFKSASALAGQSVAFQELGGNGEGSGSATAGDAWGKIEAAATEIAKSKNITVASAISEAIASNPALYDDYLKAQRG